MYIEIDEFNKHNTLSKMFYKIIKNYDGYSIAYIQRLIISMEATDNLRLYTLLVVLVQNRRQLV